MPYDFTFGSNAAKGGFDNEIEVCNKFNHWKDDEVAQEWLRIMGFSLDEIDYLKAVNVPVNIRRENLHLYNVSANEYENMKFKKADVQVQVRVIVSVNGMLRVENISVKKVSGGDGFNQVDKRTVESYQEMWGFDNEIALALKVFTGEIRPSQSRDILIVSENSLRDKDKRRAFFDEIDRYYVDKIVNFFELNKLLVITDVLKGRGGLSADWILVTAYNSDDDTTTWILKDINTAMNFFGQGDVRLSPHGSLYIGRITMQRKGGTPDPTKIQFKIKPSELFTI